MWESSFDKNVDPFEKNNLGFNPKYKNIVNKYRKKLIKQEGQLNRRHISYSNPQRLISTWGKRLCEYWEYGK